MAIEWEPVLQQAINLEVQTQVVPTKGNLVYEYNPFRNYRLTKRMYEYNGDLLSEEELLQRYGLQVYKKEEDNKNNKCWADKDGKKIEDLSNPPILHEVGELTDFITDELQFDLSHPVHIMPQYSYDGSVNLILNDGINTPKLINSRFSATGRNTYEIVDRKGNNDTNIYDQGESFKIDTSLYKSVINIPKIIFRGCTPGGNLKVGNYFFYFKLSDADGNETDFIGESSLVSVFIGFDDPTSITSGQKNENSFKNVKFLIDNIDISYDYVYVYYSRSTAEGNENQVTEYKKIERKFTVNNASQCNILITGFEETTDVTAADINLNYNIVDSAKTHAVCQNMLFMGNVHKPEIPYDELADLSLRFLPYLKEELYPLEMNEKYEISSTEKGYYDEKYIYNKTGYWEGELYRLGIVYIMPNGDLSPVFNIRGGIDVRTFDDDSKYKINLRNIEFQDKQFQYYPVFDKDGNRYKIKYNEQTNYLYDNDAITKSDKCVRYENNKGVVRFKANTDTNTVYGIDIRVDPEVITELKKHVKGYFFVRQKRIPLVLAQGITLGVDQESHTPMVATAGGFLTELQNSLDETHVTTENICDVNYIAEGFMRRYSFKFKAKSSNLWNKIGKAALIAAIVVAAAAVTIYTMGSAGPVVSGLAGTAVGTIASTMAAGITAASATAMTATTFAVLATGTAVAAAAVTAASITVAGGIQEMRYALGRATAYKKLDGRNTKCPSEYKLVETSNSRQLDGNFYDRIIIKDSSKVNVQAILCPDYEVNQPYYNQIFTGNEHTIQLARSQSINAKAGMSYNYFTNDERHFYIPSYYDMNYYNQYKFKIVGVPDDVPLVGIDNLKFRSRAGNAEEPWRYECVADDYKSDYSKTNADEDEETINNKKINSDIVRGSFGPYLAFSDRDNKFSPAETVNIYIPKYSEADIQSYINIRMHDDSIYYAITDRIGLVNSDDYLVAQKTTIVGDTSYEKYGYKYEAFRGDCYLCQFTHRLNRNFNAPSSPYNDDFVDIDTWRDNYDPDKPEKYADINIGDVNAVQLGMWVTFRVRSSNNLNIRTTDGSNIDESAMTGTPRAYFPYTPMSTEGVTKKPESALFNRGFSVKNSERWHFELPDVPYIKNWFGTRIMYSDVHINDAYTNGFRVFRGMNFRDYTREYGEIVKLVSMGSNLLCVFEHGVALIPVNERVLAGSGSGGNVYINTSNVLPENPRIISDMFGSQWPESILKVPGKTGNSPQYVYGVDTVAKKIWRTDGTTLTCISDFKVQEFLNNNITLGERENTPIIGIRNVKTVYNAFKRDVMFTFYDNTYGFEEKVWNLCWNEILEKFITFYSWVPSMMENINNIPFSFDRNVSKWIAKLGVSHANNSFSDGVTLTNNILNSYVNTGSNTAYPFVDDFTFTLDLDLKDGGTKTIRINLKNYTNETQFNPESNFKLNGFIGVLGLSNRIVPQNNMFYNVHYTLERDPWNNYQLFDILKIGEYTIADDLKYKYPNQKIPIYGLFFKQLANGLGSTSNHPTSPKFTSEALMSELYYRNIEGHRYADADANKCIGTTMQRKDLEQLPPFKDLRGRRLMLPKEERVREDQIVSMLAIKAEIEVIDDEENALYSDNYYDGKVVYRVASYESMVAITTKWNMQFLTSDFWKHGQAGLMDIADDIFPTYWYGKQHPFEFEFIVVNDPSVHKIFTNLELIANKAKPESFHYEVIGEAYDFAKDKVNMYFRQEAIKALWQYNGLDIQYDRNFLKVQPKQNPKSADLLRTYYSRKQSINEIESYYHSAAGSNADYSHLSGGEIVYYPTRQEFRVWNHCKAVDVDDQKDTSTTSFGGRGLISSNMRYLEDRWKVTINPLLVVYRNEYYNGLKNTTWPNAYGSTTAKLPPLPIYNSPIPEAIKQAGTLDIPGISEDTSIARSNALYHLYNVDDFGQNGNYMPLDTINWLNTNTTYGTMFGEAQNRKETDIRDKFVKVRIRYSGEELAVIDWINTIYQISYA